MATISNETMNKVNAIFESIARRPMTNDESNEIRAIATRINDADEFFLSSIAIQRAGGINSEKMVEIMTTTSKNIEERLRVFVTSDMQKTLWELKESLLDLGNIADSRLAYKANQITDDAKREISKSILEEIQKKIDGVKSKTNILAIGLSISVSLLIGLGVGYFVFRF